MFELYALVGFFVLIREIVKTKDNETAGGLVIIGVLIIFLWPLYLMMNNFYIQDRVQEMARDAKRQNEILNKNKK